MRSRLTKTDILRQARLNGYLLNFSGSLKLVPILFDEAFCVIHKLKIAKSELLKVIKPEQIARVEMKYLTYSLQLLHTRLLKISFDLGIVRLVHGDKVCYIVLGQIKVFTSVFDFFADFHK